MPITRRSLLSATAPAFLRGAQPPNFLLLITDQQTHSALSCAGNPWLRTPAMDSLAARGTRFSSAYCPYPVCSPSRSSIFSGAMPHVTGVMVNGKPIRQGLPTLGEIFSRAGYQTAYGGKWHLPRGFDGMTGFTKIIGGSAMGADMDAPLSAAAARWIEGRPKEPFFLAASFMNPHDICEWIRQHRGTREHAKLAAYPPAPANLEVDPNEPECVQYHRQQRYDSMSEAVGIAAKWRPEEFRYYLHDYCRLVEQVDREIGAVLDALNRTGLAQKTVVAFCSDHGEGMGGHRWVQKASFYEESARVPLILAGPGIPAGKVSSKLVALEDLMPAFCRMAGLRVPDSSMGTDLFEGSRSQVVSELRYGDETREGRMLRTARYKYVRFRSGRNPEQLFDLRKDPGETKNLAATNQAREALRHHRALLDQWMKQTRDYFPG
jgi:arylsulfatase A-like enzyme